MHERRAPWMSIANMIVRSANTKEIARITRLFQFEKAMASRTCAFQERNAKDLKERSEHSD